MKTSTSAWVIACIGYCSLMPGAWATTIDIDFAGNSIPAAWTLNTSNGGGIFNERLEAQAVDQSASIAFTLTQPVASISLSFRGSIQDSFWSSLNSVVFETASSSLLARHMNFTFDYLNYNVANLVFPGESEFSGPGTTTYAEIFSEFLYEITLTADTATFKITDTVTSSVVADLTRTSTPFSASDVTGLSFNTLHSTGGGITWLDDIHIELVVIPIPGAVSLFASALALLTWVRRKAV